LADIQGQAQRAGEASGSGSVGPYRPANWDFKVRAERRLPEARP